MDLINILIQTIGGLGLFILGMRMMTEGLEKTAGNKIKRLLEAISSNRVIGCATGAGVTAVIQSSSATTVMLIGFVGAGIMTLQQAVGVVLGANIGTTVTAQMIAFKLTAIALPAIAIGVPMKYFPKKRQYRHIGEIVLGFGLLFYGMTVMKNGLAPIRTDPEFIAFFTKFNTDSIPGILLCVGMGALVTFMVQSSSATVGLTMTLASQGLISFPTAMALVLGENIGTTITAELAIIGSTSTSAHQTARAHTLFNVLGVSMMVLIFPWFLKLIEFITLLMGFEPVTQVVNGEIVNVSRYIANGHTIFNVLNAMFFLAFLPTLIKVAIFLSPGKKKSKERYRLPQFEATFIDSSIGALAKVRGEVTKMAEFTRMNLQKISTCLVARDDDKLAEREFVENHIDAMQKIIIKYLTTIFQGGVNASEANEISEMMRITNNIERVGDSIENISKLIERVYEKDINLSEMAREDLMKISKEVDNFFAIVINELGEETEDFYTRAAAQEDLIDQMREDMRHNHVNRLREEACSVDAGVHFITLLSNFEKIGDYCFNIAIGANRIHEK
ncbi:MAG: Na/Pi cotransporter family protein [Thermodesulfobacteriota bacterium]|nr:Na/Pi cotransporter family protein [Thermodesulfobacteriota bacterium]